MIYLIFGLPAGCGKAPAHLNQPLRLVPSQHAQYPLPSQQHACNNSNGNEYPGARRAVSADPREATGRVADLSGEAAKGGGAEGDRTPDLDIANVALSQLSYGPIMTLPGPVHRGVERAEYVGRPSGCQA